MSDSFDSLINRAAALALEGSFRQASEIFSECIRENPDASDAYLGRGRCAAKLGEHEHAIEDFNAALDSGQHSAEVLCARAMSHAALGNHPAALVDLNECLRLRSDFAEAYCARAAELLHDGQAAAGIDDAAEAIRLNPCLAEAYYQRHIANAALGRSEFAAEDYEEARRLGCTKEQSGGSVQTGPMPMEPALPEPEPESPRVTAHVLLSHDASNPKAAQSMDDSAEPTRDLTPPYRESSSNSTHQLQPGDVLGNRFAIVRFLARGGNGEVYEAEDRELRSKHIALKTLRIDRVEDLRAPHSFEHEVLMAREVLHPNVCPTYDLFRVQGPHGRVVFLTMKLLRGESLSARLRRVKRLSPAEALILAQQMADGLDAAHRVGVIHRDFKAANVMLTGSGGNVDVSITDFGLARLLESDVTLAEARLLSGTPGYIAPELRRGTPASPASDVYAFGVVLREMLTGRQPDRLHPNTSVLVTKMDGLPEVWANVINGCLQENPADRFQSAGEALRGLKDYPQAGASATQPIRFPRRTAIGIGVGAIGAVSWFGWPAIDSALHQLGRFVGYIKKAPARQLP